jgi:hypothetical protein
MIALPVQLVRVVGELLALSSLADGPFRDSPELNGALGD